MHAHASIGRGVEDELIEFHFFSIPWLFRDVLHLYHRHGLIHSQSPREGRIQPQTPQEGHWCRKKMRVKLGFFRKNIKNRLRRKKRNQKSLMLAFRNSIQTHKRFRRTLTLKGRHKTWAHFRGEPHFPSNGLTGERF